MSTIRTEARELFATTLDWLADDFAVAIMALPYTYDASHTRLSDINAAVYDTIPVTAGKDATDGVLSATDPGLWTFPSADDQIIGAWLYHDTGVPGTSELLAWYDKRSSGLPILVTTIADPMMVRWPADRFGLGFITL